jgi:hypothetical protein
VELFRPWKGTIYRVTTLKYHDPCDIILLGEGKLSLRRALECDRVLSRRVRQHGALAESKANADLPYSFREPRLVVAADVSLCRVVDLTAVETLKALEVSEAELRREDWRKVREQGFASFTQALGRCVVQNES